MMFIRTGQKTNLRNLLEELDPDQPGQPPTRYEQVMPVFVIERDQYGNMVRIIPCKQPVDMLKLAEAAGGGRDE